MYQTIQARGAELEKKLNALKKQMDNLPEGELSCTENGKYYKWYKYLKHQWHYIPKEKRPEAEALAVKTYLSNLMVDLQQEQAAINAYLSYYDPRKSRAEYILMHPGYQELLSNYFQPISVELQEWMQEPYEKNPKNPENLLIKSVSGNLLRSKSEAFIDAALFYYKVPYRYECGLQMGEVTFYPDFTLRHPNTGKIYYWEHFGMMDNPEYAENAYRKLQTYQAYEILPSDNLIMTFEDKNHPFDGEKAERTVQYILTL